MDDVEIKQTRESIGYGSVSYEIMGDREAVSRAIDSILRNYPPEGYDTKFDWPPPGAATSSSEWRAVSASPTYLGDNRWFVRGSRRNSCD